MFSNQNTDAVAVLDHPAVACRPFVRAALERTFNRTFWDPELCEEAGASSRALVHSAINRLPNQVQVRRSELAEIISLDESLESIQCAKDLGFDDVHLFGRLAGNDGSALQAGNHTRVHSNRWDWQVIPAAEAKVMIPPQALERLTRLRMAGLRFREFVGTPVSHASPSFAQLVKSEAKEFALMAGSASAAVATALLAPLVFSDPVLLVCLEDSPFLIEVYRWE